MLPWIHATISLMAMYFLVSYLSIPLQMGIKWIIVGILFGTLIDLDHIIYLFLKSGKNKKVMMKYIFRPKKLFNEMWSGKLVMRTIERTLLHVVTMLFTFLLAFIFLKVYLIPIGVSLLIHLICDLPDLRFGTIEEIKRKHKTKKKLVILI